MNPTKGYYSVLQYCPDLTKLEAANVGVLLFCPEGEFLVARTSRNNDRVRKFFGSEGRDWRKINLLKAAFEDRVAAEAGKIRTLDDLQQFIGLMANQLQLTAPRSMRVEEPAEDLRRLFKQLVEVSPHHRERTRLRHAIGEKIRRANLGRRVRENIPVNVPILGREVRIDYGFQNGKFNLIQPASFCGDASSSTDLACRYAVEGESLHDHTDPELGAMQLIVVGEFRSKKDETWPGVSRILAEHQVRLLPAWHLDELIHEILTTGKDLPVQPGSVE
jgi:hypothetical protein